jgi:hypothetical protein
MSKSVPTGHGAEKLFRIRRWHVKPGERFGGWKVLAEIRLCCYERANVRRSCGNQRMVGDSISSGLLMTPEAMRKLREKWGLRQEDMATLLGVNRRTICTVGEQNDRDSQGGRGRLRLLEHRRFT